MIEFGSIIGGAQIQTGRWIDVHNPYTGALTGRVAEVPKN
jgi:hypothetical protein